MTLPDRIAFRGGACIGWVNATWPLAKLTVEHDRLRLSCLGVYEFAPSQIVALEPYGGVPFLSSGLQIVHNRNDYPALIVFWFPGDRERLLSRIERAGFTAQGQARPRPEGFPVRWGVVAAVVVFWNLLFLAEMLHPDSGRGVPGPFVAAALISAFVLATSIRVSGRVQRIVLRDGHRVGEIKAFLSLLQVVSGVLSLVFTAIWFDH